MNYLALYPFGHWLFIALILCTFLSHTLYCKKKLKEGRICSFDNTYILCVATLQIVFVKIKVKTTFTFLITFRELF